MKIEFHKNYYIIIGMYRRPWCRSSIDSQQQIHNIGLGKEYDPKERSFHSWSDEIIISSLEESETQTGQKQKVIIISNSLTYIYGSE